MHIYLFIIKFYNNVTINKLAVKEYSLIDVYNINYIYSNRDISINIKKM